MENASKALIMAAGVLIGIMIMSLAVYLFVSFGNETSKVYDRNKEQQLVEFNAEYTKYEGKDNITIYEVISVANKANENNKYYEVENTSDDNYIQVKLNGINIENSIENNQYRIDSSIGEINQNNPNLKTYSCSVEYSTSGKVNKVSFSEK